jgi:hypothetical protein
MHAFHPPAPARRTLKKSLYAVMLLSLGSTGCEFFEEENRAPTITQVLPTPASINEGANTSLSVTASDPDGDALTYTWTQLPESPAGTFGGETGATRTWTAPALASNTTFSLQVTVSDGKGGSAQATVDVAVANVPAPNRAPTVDEAITVASPAVAGDIGLSIGATDPDGDTLTYAWSTSVAGQGTFTAPTASETQWRSPELATATTYAFQVTVSDGTTSVTRTLDVQVGVPQYARDIQPLWNSLCTGCHSASPTRGGLNLVEGTSYGSIVNVSAAGSPCGPTGRKRVLPGNPDESLMVNKLLPSPVCGSRMPPGNPTHFDNNPGQLIRIRSWILAGAANN